MFLKIVFLETNCSIQPPFFVAPKIVFDSAVNLMSVWLIVQIVQQGSVKISLSIRTFNRTNPPYVHELVLLVETGAEAGDNILLSEMNCFALPQNASLISLNSVFFCKRDIFWFRARWAI